MHINPEPTSSLSSSSSNLPHGAESEPGGNFTPSHSGFFQKPVSLRRSPVGEDHHGHGFRLPVLQVVRPWQLSDRLVLARAGLCAQLELKSTKKSRGGGPRPLSQHTLLWHQTVEKRFPFKTIRCSCTCCTCRPLLVPVPDLWTSAKLSRPFHDLWPAFPQRSSSTAGAKRRPQKLESMDAQSSLSLKV